MDPLIMDPDWRTRGRVNTYFSMVSYPRYTPNRKAGETALHNAGPESGERALRIIFILSYNLHRISPFSIFRFSLYFG